MKLNVCNEYSYFSDSRNIVIFSVLNSNIQSHPINVHPKKCD